MNSKLFPSMMNGPSNKLFNNTFGNQFLVKSEGSTKANSPNIDFSNCSQNILGYQFENGGFGGMDFEKKAYKNLMDT